MRLITQKEFQEYVGKFFKEVLCKPCQPLGCKGMFLPWKSGNWKGALQQWLACLLIIQTIIAVVSGGGGGSGIFFIPVYYYCAWNL